MKKIVSVVLIAMMSFACGSSFFQKAIESRVMVNSKEYKVFYKVEREQGDINWEGIRLGVVRYKIRDEATKNSEFYLRIIYDTHYGSSFLRFVAYPMYFSKVDSHSFLQKIILENKEDKGQEIFRDIFDQLERSINK